MTLKIMAGQFMIFGQFLCLTFLIHVWCTIILTAITAATATTATTATTETAATLAITATTASDSKTMNNGDRVDDVSPYINLMLCPLQLQPWYCANRESRHILDNWNNELYNQWNKLKEDADHEVYITSDRRDYTINQYYTKEKPSTILKKIEIGVHYMKRYLAETLDGFLGREMNNYKPTIRRHKFNNQNESWPRLLHNNKLNKLRRTEKIHKIMKETLDNTLPNISVIGENESSDKTANPLSMDNKIVESMNGINLSQQLQNANNRSYNSQRGLYKNYRDEVEDDNDQHTFADTTLNEDSSEIVFEKLPNDQIDDAVMDGGFDSKHTKIMKYSRSSGVQRGKKKKKKKAIIKLMLLGSFLKAKIELLLKIFSAGLQVKFFGIALIGLLINIARFWIDLKRGSSQKVVFVEHAHHQHHYDDHGDDWEVGGGGYWKRSLQMDTSFNNNKQRTTLSQDMAYRNQRNMTHE